MDRYERQRKEPELMSRSQLARTPENFPRMKHRAAGRLTRRNRKAPLNAFESAIDILNRVIDGLRAIGEAFARAFTPPPVQTDFVLLPGLPDPFTDSEGRALVQAIHDRKALADEARQS
jgi:hypothetical protein